MPRKEVDSNAVARHIGCELYVTLCSVFSTHSNERQEAEDDYRDQMRLGSHAQRSEQKRWSIEEVGVTIVVKMKSFG